MLAAGPRAGAELCACVADRGGPGLVRGHLLVIFMVGRGNGIRTPRPAPAAADFRDRRYTSARLIPRSAL